MLRRNLLVLIVLKDRCGLVLTSTGRQLLLIYRSAALLVAPLGALPSFLLSVKAAVAAAEASCTFVGQSFHSSAAQRCTAESFTTVTQLCCTGHICGPVNHFHADLSERRGRGA